MKKQKSGNCFKVLSIMALGSFLAISTPADAAKNNKKQLVNRSKIKSGNII
jgi:predicted secreted protein